MKAHAKTRIGHVHLQVADLERSLAFYRDILGFEVTARMGDSAVFLSASGFDPLTASGYHHHIALNTWQGKGVPPQPKGTAGLYHYAILFPNRKELAKALKSLVDAKYPISGASDHGVSEAIYLEDPDGIGIELYADRPKSKWKNGAAGIEMGSKHLDLQNLLTELS